MSGRATRAASALRSSTVAAGLAVGNTISTLAPQLAGAIDIVIVEQPDGSLKSSPFYVRFGKYTGLRTTDRRVLINVNGKEADFAMHLGRSGEAYFVSEVPSDSGGEAAEEALAGMMSPPSGYSSGDEAVPYATAKQAASIQAAVEGLREEDSLTADYFAEDVARAPRDLAAARDVRDGAALRQADASGTPAAESAPRTTSVPVPAAPAAAAAAAGPLKAASAPAAVDERACGEAAEAWAQAPAAVAASGAGSGASSLSHAEEASTLAIERPERSAAELDRAASSTSSSRPPAHPWSASHARLLPTPLGAQGSPAVISAEDAAAPVGAGAAAGPSAIRAVEHEAPPGGLGPEVKGGRMELEAIDALLCVEGQAAPAALALAQRRLDAWEAGGPAPSDIPHAYRKIAEGGDRDAAAAAPAAVAAAPRAGSEAESTAPSSAPMPTGAAAAPLSGERARVEPGTPTGAAGGSGVGSCAAESPQASPFASTAAQASHSGSLGGFLGVQSVAPDANGSAAEPAHQPPTSNGGLSPWVKSASAPAPNAAAAPWQSPEGGTIEARSESWPPTGGLAAQQAGHELRSNAAQQAAIRAVNSIAEEDPEEGVALRSDSWLQLRGGRDGWPALAAVELSLCARRLQPGMGPAEAWEVFQASRVSRAAFEEAGPVVLSSPDLVVRLGGALYPWAAAAPAIVGALAFGGRWDSALTAGAGIPVAAPASPGADAPGALSAPAGSDAAASSGGGGASSLGAGERRGWRVWLGSWRRREGSGRRGDAPPPNSVNSLGQVEAGDMAGRQDSATSTAASAALPQGSGVGGGRLAPLRRTLKRRAFTPTLEQLASLGLRDGQNTIDFTFGRQRLRAYIYFLHWHTRLVISDIDGTITKSDLLGHVLPRVGWDWSHSGITRLYQNVRLNGYQILFLSSRAIAQASATRDYLHSLNQNGETLPDGPVIISPDGLFPSLYRELVLRRPHEFKIRCLEDIRALFPPEYNPFYAGFGNRDTDEISYLTVGIPAAKIFIINPRGELRKASSAVTTSSWSTLVAVNALVHEMFPPVAAVLPADTQTPREEYNDYNFWHVAPPVIIDSEDNEPPGPDADDEEEEDEDEDDGEESDDDPRRNGLAMSSDFFV
ncbi:hypothetical protein WJX81_001736 [Elliptochloris bilobata]|uniref:phosphatidate phosphatase n=1 Tax=Elliptochloris bilobata TaxID=381761 RepID=A0AAW1QLT9_9CHLO